MEKDTTKYDVLYSPDNENIIHNPIVGKQRAEFLYDCLVKQYNENLVAVLEITEKQYLLLKNKEW